MLVEYGREGTWDMGVQLGIDGRVEVEDLSRERV